MSDSILAGKNESSESRLLLRMASRHGLIAGATGTGKTVTLQLLAENFSRNGIPVFMADVKGDLSGISQKGNDNPKVLERINKLGLENFSFSGNPVEFWDLFGQDGHPVRTTVSEMGPLLLARLLDLNETQAGVLNIAFRVADDQGLLLLDLKDLKSMLQEIAARASELTTEYGNVSAASVGAIQRSLLALEDQGGALFFGEPALNLADFIQTRDGRGVINILCADKLINSPRLYSTFLLWLLSELFESLPEAGDTDKPKIVFFFDEAHLLFNEAPRALLEKIEQVTRLIRSKGVGVYFVTQNPLDVPDEVLGQLGNRVQHALRAFTARDQKAVKAAAQTFRDNPSFREEEALTDLAVGEALVSFLDEKGSPSVVERTWICPPGSRIGPVTPEERSSLVRQSSIGSFYRNTVDRESAYEILLKRAEQQKAEGSPEKKPVGRPRQGFLESFFKSTLRSVGSSIGREITRGVLGSFKGGKGGSRF